MIPYPIEDVPLSDILDFKYRRHDQLLSFREELDEYHDKLSNCETQSDISEITISFSEIIQKGVNDLVRVLDEAKMPVILGVFKTLIQPNSTALWATIISAFDSATKFIPPGISKFLFFISLPYINNLRNRLKPK